MSVRIRRQKTTSAHWLMLLLGLAVLLDVAWLASRMQQPARASSGAVPQQVATGEASDRTGPPALHMHTVF